MNLKFKKYLVSSIVSAFSLLLIHILVGYFNLIYLNTSIENKFSAKNNKAKNIVIGLQSVFRNIPVPEAFIASKGGYYFTFRANQNPLNEWLATASADWLINNINNTSFVLPNLFIINLNFEFLKESKFNDDRIDFSGIDPPFITA